MQSKLHSLFEAIINVGSGLLLSIATWKLIITPIFGIEANNSQVVLISAIFTILSILRSYFWRRLFNKYDAKAL